MIVYLDNKLVLDFIAGPYDNEDSIDPPELLQFDHDTNAAATRRQFGERLLAKKKQFEEYQRASQQITKVPKGKDGG